MRSHAKAPSAGSIEGSGSSSRLFRRAFATRGASSDCKGSGAPSLRLLGLVLLTVACFAVFFGVATAQAAPTYHDLGEFGSDSLASVPTKIAFDDTAGNVLVVDSPNNRILVFHASGPSATLLTEFGSAELSSPYGIAVDQSNGDVYVSDAGHSRIVRYTTDGAENPTYAFDESYASPSLGANAEAGEVGNFASAIAINPTNGDLLIADAGNRHVSRFDSSGKYLATFDGTGSEGGAFTSLLDIAVDAGGDIYVVANGGVNEIGVAEGSIVERFGSGGVAKESLGEPGQLSGARAIAIDPNSDDVLVSTGGGYAGYGGPATLNVLRGGDLVEGLSYSGDSNAPPVGLTVDSSPSARVYGLTASGKFYATPYGVQAVRVFKLLEIPDPTAGAPSAVTDTTAHLSGTVNPHGEAGVRYRFEYSSDGGANWTPTPEKEAGSGEAPEAVEADLTALMPNLEYRVRLDVSLEGIHNSSSTETFVTIAKAPGTVTGDATGRTTSGATLRGTVNPFGLQTTYHFEYGATTAYGTFLPRDHEAVAGKGRTPLLVAQNLSGLQPGITYHYRLVAENSIGSEAGEDRTFTTRTANSPKRAYELISPAEKNGANVDPLYPQVAANGEAVSFTAKSALGSIPVESSPLFIRYTARRSSGGWIVKGTDPPQPRQYSERVGLFYTVGMSEDGTKAVVLSTQKLADGGIAGDSNTYLRDIVTGGYTTISTTPGSIFFTQQTSFAIGISEGHYITGTPNFDHVLLTAADLPGAPKDALFEFTGGQLRVASVAPDGTPLPDDKGAGGAVSAQVGMISDDGSKIFFSSGRVLYVRIDGQTTHVISQSHRAEDFGAAIADGEIIGASRDGNIAYIFSHDLTEDSEPGVRSLYRYTVASGELEMLTPAPGGNASAYWGQWVSDDGSAAYFQDGWDIKVWRDGELSPVASLSLEEAPYVNEVMPSPNGRYLVFQSASPLAGYDNSSNACPEGGKCPQVYRYDAGTHTLACPSCRSDGGKPTGKSDVGTPFRETFKPKLSHTVDNQGRVFFDTPEQLVAADTNSVQDVYEYDDSGATLVSSGQSAPAQILGASADGRDIFFTTQNQLVGVDTDSSMDIYDARIGGGIASQNPPPGREECIRDDCKATPNQGPELPFGGSEGLNGPENVSEAARKRCGKGRHARKVKGKQRCVKQQKKRTNKSRANDNRRQGR